jgi:DNA-binding transcriptional LysR family regulator
MLATIAGNIRASSSGVYQGRIGMRATPSAVARACAAHPRLRVSVLSLSSIEIERRMGRFEVDAGVTYLDNEPLRGVRSHPVARESFVLVGGPARDADREDHSEERHSQRCRAGKRRRDLRQHNFFERRSASDVYEDGRRRAFAGGFC